MDIGLISVGDDIVDDFSNSYACSIFGNAGPSPQQITGYLNFIWKGTLYYIYYIMHQKGLQHRHR